MGLLDNNKIITTPRTGLEGSDFKLLVSNEAVDIWKWSKTDSQKNLRVTFRDIFVWSDNDALYLVKGKITDTPTKIDVNSTNFPNLRQSGGNNPTIEKVIVCPCDFCYAGNREYGNISSINGKDCRVCVIFSNGQIYHNYPSCNNNYDFYNPVWATNGGVRVETLFTKFDESVVWDLPNRKAPATDADLIATGAYYYNPALPANNYEMHPAISASNGYGNTIGFPSTNNVNPISNGEDIGLRSRFWMINRDNDNCNSFCYMGGYIADNLFTMIGTYRSNQGTNPARICVFGTQDGGRSWYCMYEFAGKDRLKVGTTYTAADGTIGIPVAQEGSVSSGIYKIKRRTIVVPNSSDKEPSTLFEYDKELNISSIAGTSSAITVTTESAHGLSNGDTIIIDFQNNISANGRAFDWMVNSSADATTGGNGIMFKVSNASGTTFTLTMYVWNPYSGLPIRHIHALNKCKDGVSVSCGEKYPHGGWILYDAIREADAFAHYNVAKQSTNIFTRLTSTADSFQRPLGVILQQEGLDTYCYIGVDNESTPMNDVEMPEGRTDSFKHNSCGVWKVKLDGIDSQKDNGLMKYNARQTCFGLQEIGSAFVFTGQFGAFGISYDNGESWLSAQLPPDNSGQDLANFSGMSYDRKFSINNILVQLKK